MQNTESNLPKRPAGKWAVESAAALGRGGMRVLAGAGRAWRETAAGVASAQISWAAALVMATGALVMLAGLAAGIWLREKPLLTVGICAGSLLAGVIFVGLSRVVAAAELYIRRNQ